MEKTERTEDNRKSRKRDPKKPGRSLPTVILLVVFLCALLGAGIYVYVVRYMPTSEKADLGEYFDGVSGDDMLLYLDLEEQKTADGSRPLLAQHLNGAVYLPYEWVMEHLNRRFYWAQDKHSIYYTLPGETRRFGQEDRASDGSLCARYLGSGNSAELYLSAAFVKEFTDIRYDAFLEGEHKRVFVYTDWTPYETADLTGKERVRLAGGVKSPVLTELARGETVRILEAMENWTKVLTGDGFIGYLRNKKLSGKTDFTPESSFTVPDYPVLTMPGGRKPVLGFHQVTNAGANASLLQLIGEGMGHLNVVAPTWFVLSDNAGNFVSYASKDYVTQSHAAGLQVWAVVNNFDLGNIDEKPILRTTEIREKVIRGLVDLAVQVGVDGLNIDLEAIPESLGRDYVQFMRELSVACHQAGLVLSVDCYVPYHYNTHYDLGELGVFCDYVLIMCYDEHYAGSEEPGSVASIGYTQRGITETAKQVPVSRIIIAVPFYTRVWKTKDGKLSSDALSLSGAADWVRERGVNLTWDFEVGQNYGQIQDGDTLKQVWLEDVTSLKVKADKLREAGVGGVAAWKLGWGTPEIWSILDLNS